MKILHTADWHLGKKLERFSRMEEQKAVLEEIIQIAENEKVDAVLVAGDLFDHYNPASEAIELFYKSLKRLTNNGKRAVVAIAGNHDSPDRIEAPDPLARECGIIFAGYPLTHINTCELDCGIHITQSTPGFIELTLPDISYPLRLILTPYANEYRLKLDLGVADTEAQLREILQAHWKDLADRFCDDKGVNLLVTHLFMMKKGTLPPEEPEDEKPILHIGGAQAIYSENVPAQMQYVAVGHLHRYQVIDNQPCPVVYSSSPLAYSFSEAGQQKQVVLLDVSPGKPVQYRPIPLTSGRPLVRKRFDAIDTAVSWLQENPEVLVELTIASEDYLKADDRKRIMQAHAGIVALIPEISNPELLDHQTTGVDLNLDLDALFGQFFKHRYGQEANEDLLELFKEIRAEAKEI